MSDNNPIDDIPTVNETLEEVNTIAVLTERLRVQAEAIANAEAERLELAESQRLNDLVVNAAVVESNRQLLAMRLRINDLNTTNLSGRLTSIRGSSQPSDVPPTSSPPFPAPYNETFVTPIQAPADDTFLDQNVAWQGGGLTGMAAFVTDDTPTRQQFDASQQVPPSPPVAPVPSPVQESEAKPADPDPANELHDQDDIIEILRDQLRQELVTSYQQEYDAHILKLNVELTKQYSEKLAVDTARWKREFGSKEVTDSVKERRLQDEELEKLDPTSRTVKQGQLFQERAIERKEKQQRQGEFAIAGRPKPVRSESLMTSSASQAAKGYQEDLVEKSGTHNVVHTPISFKSVVLTHDHLSLAALQELFDRVIMHEAQPGNKPVCLLVLFKLEVQLLLLDRHNDVSIDAVRCAEFGYQLNTKPYTLQVVQYFTGQRVFNFFRQALTPRNPRENEEMQQASYAHIESKWSLVPDINNCVSASKIDSFISAQKEKINIAKVHNDWYPQFSLETTSENRPIVNSNCSGSKPNASLNTVGFAMTFMSGPGWGIVPPKGAMQQGRALSVNLVTEWSTNMNASEALITPKQKDNILFTLGRWKAGFDHWAISRQSTRKQEATFPFSSNSPTNNASGVADTQLDPLALKLRLRQPLEPARAGRDVSIERSADDGGNLIKRKSPQYAYGEAQNKSRNLRALVGTPEMSSRLNALLRESYERSTKSDPNQSNGAFFDEDGELEEEQDHFDNDHLQLLDGEVLREYREDNELESEHSQELQLESYGSPSYHHEDKSQLRNLDGRGEQTRHGQDSRQQRPGGMQAHGGRPPDRTPDRGRGSDQQRDSRDTSRQQQSDPRHDTKYPRNDAGKLVETNTRGKSPDRIKWESEQACRGLMTKQGCKVTQAGGKCGWSHDPLVIWREYSEINKVMEPQRSKRDQQGSQLVTALKASATPTKAGLQVLKRGSDHKAVSFDAQKQQADAQHANAQWYSNRLSVLNAEYIGRQQHVAEDNERRPTTERVEELLDDYQSSGYSSTDDA